MLRSLRSFIPPSLDFRTPGQEPASHCLLNADVILMVTVWPCPFLDQVWRFVHEALNAESPRATPTHFRAGRRKFSSSSNTSVGKALSVSFTIIDRSEAVTPPLQ